MSAYQNAMLRYARRARKHRLFSTEITLLSWRDCPPSVEWATLAANYVRGNGGGCYDQPNGRRLSGFLLGLAAVRIAREVAS